MKPIPTDRRSGARCYRSGTVASGAGVLTLAIVLASPLEATREIVSDMDCVVEPSLTVDLGTAVPGLLSETYFDRADHVARGTVMARLENDVESLTVAIAESSAADDSAVDLRRLTAAFGLRTRERNATLADENAISTQTLDQVRTETAIAELQVMQERRALDLAELELQRARALLAQREIRSPINGSVMHRYAAAGEYVDSEPVYRVAQLDPLHVEVIVPIDYLDLLQVGTLASVKLQAPGFENREMPAEVRRVDAVADPASATYGVRLVLPNPDLDIPGGVRCSVSFFAS